MNVGRWREDAKIHRCDCGGWVYADNPCGACDPAPVHTLPTPRVDNSTRGVRDDRDERRTA